MEVMTKGINWSAYTDFWYWVNERHRIYIKKSKEEPKPWSQDPIFQNWKFCNVFRELDKESQYLQSILVRNTVLNDRPTYETLFNIFVYRAFNWYPTYKRLGLWQTDWDVSTKASLLYGLPKLTSGAYMIRGREGIPKAESICMTLQEVWDHIKPLTLAILEGDDSLQHAFECISVRKFWGWGPFTTYQVVLDMMMVDTFYGPHGPTDLNTWCAFGPGAKRGLREIWPDIPLKNAWLIEGCKYLLADQVKYREEHVPELDLQDIEFSLCELSKYRRLKAGGRSKATYNGT